MAAHKLTSEPLVPAAWVHRGQGIEAVHTAAIAVVDPPTTAATSTALRALSPILVETLKQLGLIDDIAKFPTLARYEMPSVSNARKLKTGEIRADFRLVRR